MIFLNVENISEKDIEILEKEKEFLQLNIAIQKKKKENILNNMESFTNSSSLMEINSVNQIISFLEDLKNSSELCNQNLSYYDTCINSIENIIFSINNHSRDLENILKSFNSDYYELNKLILDNSLKIENNLCNISKKSEFNLINNSSDIKEIDESEVENTFEEEDVNEEDDVNVEKEPIIEDSKVEENIPISESTSEPNKPIFEESIKQETQITADAESTTNMEDDSKYKEKTLIVSQALGKVTLPYDLSRVKEIFNTHPDKYSSLDSVINQKYTLPITMFKNPSASRFREGFKLIREREKGSIADGFELGLELMFNNNLHPAIIAACKNLDELDVYLDYLKSGQTNKFKIFKIIFDLPPAKITKKSNSII